MKIGVPKEIKPEEHRVSLVPSAVQELISHGHEVIVETSAGAGIGADDAAYQEAGASIAPTAAEVFSNATMIMKVKEPQEIEWKRLRPEHILFTYLHLAPDPKQAQGLVDSGCTAIAYETVTGDHGGLPLLAPMSEVAGRLAVIEGASCLKKPSGGKGLLISGVPGVAPANVMILGGGVVGTNAAKLAVGLGARVTIFDRSILRLRQLDDIFGGRTNNCYSTQGAIEELLPHTDLVIGAVLLPGATTPKLIRRKHLRLMNGGSVLVDVAIDQGGCFETSKPTSHVEPTYMVDDILHYCVANMPGATPKTSSYALNNVTLPYAIAMANEGLAALDRLPHLKNGLNVEKGKLVHPEVIEALAGSVQ